MKKKNAITVYYKGEYSPATDSSSWVVIPFNHVMTQIGNKLSLDTNINRIRVGEGISHVKVSATICCVPAVAKSITLSYCVDSQRKNRVRITSSTDAINVTLPSMIFEVSEGQYINVRSWANNKDKFYGEEGYYDTVLTVEVID